jgi:hypothetical protein
VLIQLVDQIRDECDFSLGSHNKFLEKDTQDSATSLGLSLSWLVDVREGGSE